MFLIINKENDVVIAKGNTCETAVNGFYLDKNTDHAVIFGDMEHLKYVEVIEVPDTFKEGKYCYTEVDGFNINPVYKEPITFDSLQVENAVLKQKVDTQQSALDDFFMNILPLIMPM